MEQEEYHAEGWLDIFRRNGLGDFESVWEREVEWFEEPNRRRGGWSGVARVVFDGADGEPAPVYLKKQENHFIRSVARPWKGELTFEREFRILSALEQQGVGVAAPVYFGVSRHRRSRRAILMTAELSGFSSLEDLIAAWRAGDRPGPRARRNMAAGIGAVIGRFHRLGYRHGALYPKHIFLDPHDPTRVRLIDLEKTRRNPLRFRGWLRDLDAFNRRTVGASRSDRLRFLLAYLGAERVTPELGSIWRELQRRERRKRG